MDARHKEALQQHLDFIYGGKGSSTVAETLQRLLELLKNSGLPAKPAEERLSQRDAVLITYGDQISSGSEAPLRTLHRFLKSRLKSVVSGVHLLPFYPYTSDDGFGVVDYLQVDPALGTWEDVEAIGEDFRLMFDAVINHVSAKSAWFRGFLQDDPKYRDYFITVDPATDLSSITRPRTSPLLTPFGTPSGTKHVWTTFSADQVDLNYENPEVLLEVVRVLLEYVRHGAEIIRLDAVTYLWKEVGSSGVHHPKTHRVMQLLRTVMDTVAPHVVLLTETNVPHAENISYFGDGHNEAQMVYNFALPPLVLYTFIHEDASTLKDWAKGLTTPSDETTFFNFLASHDGIGVRPVEALIGHKGITQLVERVKAHGGLVSYKTNSDGSQSPYELNISYFDALNNPQGEEAQELQVARFLCAQSIMLTLAGVPGIYVHSLLGSRSDHEGVNKTGHNRSINRKKFGVTRLERELDDPGGLRHAVFGAYRRLLEIRMREPAFHPQAAQQVMESPSGIFAIGRKGPQGDILCLHNVTNSLQTMRLDEGAWQEISQRESVSGSELVLAPYEVRWLRSR